MLWIGRWAVAPPARPGAAWGDGSCARSGTVDALRGAGTGIQTHRRGDQPMRPALPTLVGLLCGCSITHPALGVGAGLDWVTIGDVGNAGYDRTDPFGRATGRGSVDYAYRISKMEVSSGQWLEFLNAFGDYGDPHRAYSNVVIAGFQPDQSYTGPGRRWELRPEFAEAERMPVLGINWFNAARYCNWLHHGKTTDFDKLEYGAYDLRGSDDLIIAERSEGARYWMPSLDEHLKAAFYDPNKLGDGQGGWWEQPNGTDTELIIGAPSEGGQTNAGIDDFMVDPTLPDVLRLGVYEDVTSPYGLFDLSGGAAEFLDSGPDHPARIWRVGSAAFLNLADGNEDATFFDPPYQIWAHTGAFPGWNSFRIVTSVPAPSTALLLISIGFVGPRRRIRRVPRVDRASGNPCSRASAGRP